MQEFHHDAIAQIPLLAQPRTQALQDALPLDIAIFQDLFKTLQSRRVHSFDLRQCGLIILVSVSFAELDMQRVQRGDVQLLDQQSDHGALLDLMMLVLVQPLPLCLWASGP